MSSLFDELTQKLALDPRLTRRGGPRVDLSLLLFNARDGLRALWLAAEGEVARAKAQGAPAPPELAAAVEQLRPVFGDRPRP
jgi:hypothetical protein